jgi:hypothetical protein
LNGNSLEYPKGRGIEGETPMLPRRRRSGKKKPTEPELLNPTPLAMAVMRRFLKDRIPCFLCGSTRDAAAVGCWLPDAEPASYWYLLCAACTPHGGRERAEKKLAALLDPRRN